VKSVSLLKRKRNTQAHIYTIYIVSIYILHAFIKSSVKNFQYKRSYSSLNFPLSSLTTTLIFMDNFYSGFSLHAERLLLIIKSVHLLESSRLALIKVVSQRGADMYIRFLAKENL
jgi:hypothetical protein